jgi:hypothetical protein
LPYKQPQKSENVGNGENSDLLQDSHNSLNTWKSYYSHLLNVHSISDFRQTEVYTAQPLVTDPSCLEFETAIAALKIYKVPVDGRTNSSRRNVTI